jgi:hypothetical protein
MKHLVALLCAVGVLVVSSHAAPSQPNIITFLVDDMGVMDTSLPFPRGRQADAVSAQRLLSHAEHGAARRARHPADRPSITARAR